MPTIACSHCGRTGTLADGRREHCGQVSAAPELGLCNSIVGLRVARTCG
jgi:hypothetical protein